MKEAPGRAAGILKVYQVTAESLPERDCTQRACCCQFAVTGREPRVTHAEMAHLLALLARQGRRVPAPRLDGACPLLGADNRSCTVYEARPLGCRTHYCREAGGPATAREVRDAVQLLNALDEARGKKAGGRMFTHALEDARKGRPTHG